MNSRLRKVLCAAMCFALVLSFMSVFAVVPANVVTLRVEGIESNVLYLQNLEFTEGATVYSLLLAQLDKSPLSYEAEDGYIKSIGDDAAGKFGGWDGWVYYVNGAEPSAGMNTCTLKPGDDILVCYADPYGVPPTLMPTVAASRNAQSAAVLTFTATQTIYDADFKPSTSIVPVESIDVTVGTEKYKTDNLGQITLTPADSAKTEVTVQIAKYDDYGKPLVVRYAPDFTVAVPPVVAVKFSDVPAGIWYETFVYDLVGKGGISGYTDGTFQPGKFITRAEFIKTVAACAPEFDAAAPFKALFTDVADGMWYTPYIMWAAENGIVTDSGVFNPNAVLTRQDMAVWLCRFNDKVLGKTLPQTAEAPAFDDAGSIADYAAESVYLLQKAGIISGSPSASGGFIFQPQDGTQRSHTSKVISTLLALD